MRDMANDDPVPGIVAQLTPNDVAVLRELHREYGTGPRHMAATLNISVAAARASLQTLRLHGLCDFGCLISEDDGLLRGRGYWRDTFGDKVIKRIEAMQAPLWMGVDLADGEDMSDGC